MKEAVKQIEAVKSNVTSKSNWTKNDDSTSCGSSVVANCNAIQYVTHPFNS
jgi:hypothetical protein